MPQFKTEAKTGFRSNDLKIRIYDNNMDLFYSHDRDQGATFFNLPKGTYRTTNKIYICSHPRKYKLPQLPPKERNKKVPNTLQIVYGNNPHKASIYFDLNKIFIDNSIKNLSKPQKRHIILHEIAHYYYKTEQYCDLWAAREMLKAGYNPSQVFFSVYGTLSNSPDSVNRKEFILENCENAFNV
jgi:hypothetical protein